MGNTAIVFPGQGSQKVGMLDDIAAEYPIIQQTFAEASVALGYDLWDLVQNGPADKLNQTEFTQPAILASDIAMWRLLQQEHAITPNFFAGHSLGEYSALVAAGVLSFDDAVQLVAKRGQLMQQAVPESQGGNSRHYWLGSGWCEYDLRTSGGVPSTSTCEFKCHRSSRDLRPFRRRGSGN